jgi:heat-inducible transcriptional repressor
MSTRSPKSQISSERLLDARAQFVLSEIIGEHRLTGEPVGSRTVAERCANGAGWSAPTIRNVMAELEETGFVEQPHTSAGRVPTDMGYRYYVDHMIGSARVSKADTETIDNLLDDAGAGANPARLMERVSHLLSEMSENVGIVVSPSLAENLLQHIEFVALADGGILVVMIFTPNIVQNKIVRLNETLAQDELDRTARYLNAEFTGKSLTAIRAEIIRLMRAEKALYDRLLCNAALLFERGFEDDEPATGDVYVDGASNILDKPEFANVGRLRELLRTLEEKSRLVQILGECITLGRGAGQVHVHIGREFASPSLRGCALIGATYRVGSGEIAGTLGVVGPMRIEYARLMAVVNYVAQRMERVLRDDAASV